MELKRTANAGILLKLDGVSILLDGVCREVKPYPATPPEERAALRACYPDIVAFTHAHKDHYDSAFAAEFVKQTGGVILGPEGLPGVRATMEPMVKGNVTVQPIPSRHIGAAGKSTPHASFIISGSKCVWFLGDSAPTLWRDRKDLLKPDVLVVPYAYAITPASWAISQGLGSRHMVLLHMPAREQDSLGLWDGVEATVGRDSSLLIPEMGQSLELF